MSSRDVSIVDALQASADRHPDKLLYAFLDGDGRTRQSYGYADFIRRTAEVAAHIHQHRPLARNERVLLVYPSGLEMISAFFACVRMGLIPVPVYPPASSGFAPCSFSTAYGLAECTLAVTGRGRDIRAFDAARLRGDDSEAAPSAPGMETAKELVSCGRPLGATEVAIVDVQRRREVLAGRVGEIWVAGPSKCLGYWGRPELSAEVFEARSGDAERTWLRTGDLGFVEDGELFVCGRAKDVIIVRVANYYPHDIEVIVEEDPAVRRGCVAAFGAADDGYDPGRFEEEAVGQRHPAAHIPFGGGPRKCIGSNMAMLQMLLMVATFVRRYDFELASEAEVEAAPRMILHPSTTIDMRFWAH